MKKATSSAPHICLNVLEKTCGMICHCGRKMSRSTTQETKIEGPPAKGVKLKTDKIGLCVTEELAATDQRSQLMPGRGDFGLDQRTPTAIGRRYESQTERAPRTE